MTRRLLVRFLTILLACAPICRAEAVLSAGDTAPKLALPDQHGISHELLPTSGSRLLVFVKLEDKNSSLALGQIQHLFRDEPKLEAQCKTAVIVTRSSKSDPITPMLETLPPGWQVLYDRNDAAYRAYRIIATPTNVLINADGRVAHAHPGYDPAMAQGLRLALAETLGIQLTATQRGEAAETPDMNLQMARRLAERRLWDESLEFYGKAAKSRPLAPDDILQIARIYVAIRQPADAIRLLDSISSVTALTAKCAEVRQQAIALQANPQVKKPPIVK